MGKSEGKTKRSIVLTIILFLLVCALGYYLSILIKDNLKYKKDVKENKELIEKLNQNVKKQEDNLKEEEANLQKVKEIDKTIEDTKVEVFKLASSLEKQIKEGNNKTKIAYLTFDDGPYNITNKFLDVLDKYQVRATFFTIGLDKEICYDNKSKQCGHMYQLENKKGHTVANHTYNHAIYYGLYSSSDSFINQVKLQENLIKKKTGTVTNIVRFPGGSASAGSLKNDIIAKLKKNNYGWVDWTAMDGDGKGVITKEEGWNTFKKSIDEDIEVVLLHDYNDVTLELLPQMIEYLEENNYILLPLFYDSVMVNK